MKWIAVDFETYCKELSKIPAGELRNQVKALNFGIMYGARNTYYGNAGKIFMLPLKEPDANNTLQR